MPICTAFVDDLRAAFGEDEINHVIQLGLRPDCLPEDRVYFSENRHVLGQKPPEPVIAFTGAEIVIGDYKPTPLPTRGQR